MWRLRKLPSQTPPTLHTTMSFLAGGDCSANGNVLAQLNKHAQQDRSLQHESSARAAALRSLSNFKQPQFAPREHMDADFFQAGNHTPTYQFQPLRHELDEISRGQASNQWLSEFKNGSSLPVMRATTNKPIQAPMRASGSQSSWAREYSPLAFQLQAPAHFQPMNTNMPIYRPQGMSSLAGPRFQDVSASNSQISASQEQNINWDAQFEQIAAMGEEKVADEQVNESSEHDTKVEEMFPATFDEVWNNINGDAVESDFIDRQYEEYTQTRRLLMPPDMEQWERDFSKFAINRENYADYSFEAKNPFLKMKDAYETGLELMENGARLSEAALAFEAAVEQDSTHVDAWLKLGEVQTQNEKEHAGIMALEKCLELSPQNTEALMTLAILYINEGFDNAAFATLERWISTKYPLVAQQAVKENPLIVDEDRFSLNKRVLELFIKAAQLSPSHANMDADVQMGLGVLFYANEDFDKTIDCFKAALTIRPNDPVLWNRLGASMANSGRSEEAVDAYFKAIELQPLFVRARYNLAVSCLNIGCYKEATEHLLGALSMHQVENPTSTPRAHQSTALTETLKRALIAMNRRDLVTIVQPEMDLTPFRKEFEF